MYPRRNVRELTVDVVRADHGVWELSVVGEDDVHGHTRLLSKLDPAIAKMVENEMKLNPGDYVVQTNLRLTPELRNMLGQARSARDRLEGLQREASARTRQAVAAFREAGFSYRDMAELLGITHQRVHQIVQLIEADSDGDSVDVHDSVELTA